MIHWKWVNIVLCKLYLNEAVNLGGYEEETNIPQPVASRWQKVERGAAEMWSLHPITLKGEVPVSTEKVEKSRWAGGVACVCVLPPVVGWDQGLCFWVRGVK